MNQIGRYKLLFQLGAGGMAEVFLAHEASGGGVERLAVVKRVLPHLAQDDLFINMLLNEARISTRLNHPNIAHVYEVGKHDERTFIAMEFIHGVSVRTILRRGKKIRLSPSLAAFIGASVAGALHHAHTLTDLQGEALNVVHRDVSPDNIHISYEGVVKVIDFGIAKARTNVEDTMSGVFKGKHSYTSPEQAKFEEIDHRSDIFALGIVLHEMLTYKKLFKGKEVGKNLQQIIESEIPPPSAVAATPVPEQLDAVAVRALQKDPDARYATAREMQEDLLAYLKQDPATDIDLERFMSQAFGDAEDHRRRLRESVEQNRYTPIQTPGTPSESLPTWSGVDPNRRGAGSDVGSYSQISGERREVPRSRRTLVLVLAAVATLAVAGALLTWRVLREPVSAPTPGATAPQRVDAALEAQDARPAANGPASLIVKTTPTGAQIRISGRDAGARSPTVLRALPGGTKVELIASMDGHHDDHFTVELAPGEVKEIHRRLVSKPRAKRPRPPRRPRPSTGHGTLTINAKPWAVVYIDGKRVGVTPLFKLKVSAGQHKLRLRNPDKKLEKTTTITVPRDTVVKRVFKL
jgi:eukaryotic-like serine/threonine-protein kinase